MKNLFWIIIMALAIASCAGEGTGTEGDASTTGDTPAATDLTTPVTPPDPAVTPPAQQNQVNIPAGPDGVVHHYICEKMDGGFGDAGGACPICGDPMSHNSAFHAQAQGAQTPPPVTIKNPDGSTTPGNVLTTPPPGAGGPQVTATPPPAEPAQNANGVWHYTCPSGCAGGGGSATPCGKCGTTLVHNTAYHQ